jgi:hypothetical protein
MKSMRAVCSYSSDKARSGGGGKIHTVTKHHLTKTLASSFQIHRLDGWINLSVLPNW